MPLKMSTQSNREVYQSKPIVCGMVKAVHLIGSKWVLLILHNLCADKKGFNELARLLPGISPRILSSRLKELVDHGLVAKVVLPTNPPRVEYSLTPKGESLKDILHELAQWADSI